MTIQEVIQELKASEYKGVQLEKRNGILSSTWLLYKKKENFYYFDINQEIEFIDDYKYTEEEIIERFKNAYFEIDIFIN